MSRLLEIRINAEGSTDEEGYFNDEVYLDVDDYAYLYEQANMAKRYEKVMHELREVHKGFCEDDTHLHWASGFGAAIDFIEDNLMKDGGKE